MFNYVIYKPVIKKLKQKAAEIGTIKLSIPKILNCSRIVEIKAIVKKFILNVPDDIVMSLKGIGVKPAVKTIQKFHSSYKFFILLKLSIVNPGTYSKKKLANAEYSISGLLHQRVFPMKYPNTPPAMDETLHKKAK